MPVSCGQLIADATTSLLMSDDKGRSEVAKRFANVPPKKRNIREPVLTALELLPRVLFVLARVL